MKVLLTGATGFVGQSTLAQLAAAGHSSRILVRPVTQAGRLASRGARPAVEVCSGDLLAASALANALDGVEAIIHLVGIISECGQNTFENTHVKATENLVAAAQKAAVRRFVHVSALGTRPNARSRYHQTKWAAEQIVQKSGLDYTVFRPSLIFGPQDQFVNVYTKLIRRSPVVPLLGRSDALLQPVHVETVADALVKALPLKDTVGVVFDLAGPERFTLRQTVLCILRVLHKKRLVLRIPNPLAQIQARVFEWFFPLVLRQAPPLNRDQLIMLQEDNIGDPRSADDTFRLRHIPFEQGIREYL